MEKKNNNGVIIILMGVIIVILAVLCVLFATGTIHLNDNRVNEGTSEENNKLDNNEEIRQLDEYISFEDVKITEDISIKKIKINYLDDNLTKEFYSKQNELINGAIKEGKIYEAEDSEFSVYNASSYYEYYLNDNILSIVYWIDLTHEIGTCALEKAVTNIDLVNKKILSNEEILASIDMTYKDIVNEYYEEELKSWTKLNETNNQVLDHYDVTYDDFKNNKEKYINIGLKKIKEITYFYIKDGKVIREYYAINKSTLFHPVGKGGCFRWEKDELNSYK